MYICGDPRDLHETCVGIGKIVVMAPDTPPIQLLAALLHDEPEKPAPLTLDAGSYVLGTCRLDVRGGIGGDSKVCCQDGEVVCSECFRHGAVARAAGCQSHGTPGTITLHGPFHLDVWQLLHDLSVYLETLKASLFLSDVVAVACFRTMVEDNHKASGRRWTAGTREPELELDYYCVGSLTLRMDLVLSYELGFDRTETRPEGVADRERAHALLTGFFDTVDPIKIAERDMRAEQAMVDRQERADAFELGIKLVHHATNGDIASFRKVLQAGPPDVINACNSGGNSVTAIACWKGYPEILDLCIAGGARLDKKNARGWTPFKHAHWNGHTTCMKRLLSHDVELLDICTANKRPRFA